MMLGIGLMISGSPAPASIAIIAIARLERL
jgi:hypothetical protein